MQIELQEWIGLSPLMLLYAFFAIGVAAYHSRIQRFWFFRFYSYQFSTDITSLRSSANSIHAGSRSKYTHATFGLAIQ